MGIVQQVDIVTLKDLPSVLLGRGSAGAAGSQHRPVITGRGFLLVADEESVRDSVVRCIKEIDSVTYLDFNAEPQGVKVSEMCIQAYGPTYHAQKLQGLDATILTAYGACGSRLVFDNFQDIGLQATRDVKLSLAFLRALGRPPYEVTVIAVGSTQSLDVIKLDDQLTRAWSIFEVAAD